MPYISIAYLGKTELGMEFSPDVSKPYIGVSYSAPQFSGRGFHQNGRKVHLPKLAALTCHFGQAGYKVEFSHILKGEGCAEISEIV